MRLPVSWIRSIARSSPSGGAGERLDLRRMKEEVEAGLRDIDFEEVTIEDRVSFLEQAVVWQVRRALRRGQFDLALELQQFGVRRIAQLHAGAAALRPGLVEGWGGSEQEKEETA